VNLLELIGEDKSAVKPALKLMELMSPFFIVTELEGVNGRAFSIKYKELCESEELVEVFDTEDPIELIKGFCFMICVITSLFLCNGQSPASHFQLIRQGMEKTLATGVSYDLSGQQLALNLLDATAGHGGSFHLQTHTLQQQPYLTGDVIVSLASLFYALSVEDLGRDVEEVMEYLKSILDLEP
jgi:hypothetical protein